MSNRPLAHTISSWKFANSLSIFPLKMLYISLDLPLYLRKCELFWSLEHKLFWPITKLRYEKARSGWYCTWDCSCWLKFKWLRFFWVRKKLSCPSECQSVPTTFLFDLRWEPYCRRTLVWPGHPWAKQATKEPNKPWFQRLALFPPHQYQAKSPDFWYFVLHIFEGSFKEKLWLIPAFVPWFKIISLILKCDDWNWPDW